LGVSVLIPTRGRPKRFRNAVESLLERKAGAVEVIGYLDECDPAKPEYERLEIPEVRFVVGKREGLAKAIHCLIKSSLYSYMFLGADDIECKTHGWDVKLCAAIPEDCIGLAWGDDRWKQACNHFMFHQKWVSLTGFFPDDFRHFGPDTYVLAVAKGLKREFLVKDVVIEHKHYKVNQKLLDKTYEEARMNDGPEFGKKKLKEHEKTIERDIATLREYI
jgi:hypothetical protein